MRATDSPTDSRKPSTFFVPTHADPGDRPRGARRAARSAAAHAASAASLFAASSPLERQSASLDRPPFGAVGQQDSPRLGEGDVGRSASWRDALQASPSREATDGLGGARGPSGRARTERQDGLGGARDPSGRARTERLNDPWHFAGDDFSQHAADLPFPQQGAPALQGRNLGEIDYLPDRRSHAHRRALDPTALGGERAANAFEAPARLPAARAPRHAHEPSRQPPIARAPAPSAERHGHHLDPPPPHLYGTAVASGGEEPFFYDKSSEGSGWEDYRGTAYQQDRAHERQRDHEGSRRRQRTETRGTANQHSRAPDSQRAHEGTRRRQREEAPSGTSRATQDRRLAAPSSHKSESGSSVDQPSSGGHHHVEHAAMGGAQAHNDNTDGQQMATLLALVHSMAAQQQQHTQGIEVLLEDRQSRALEQQHNRSPSPSIVSGTAPQRADTVPPLHARRHRAHSESSSSSSSQEGRGRCRFDAHGHRGWDRTTTVTNHGGNFGEFVAETATAKSVHLLRSKQWLEENIRQYPDLRHLALAHSVQPSAEALDQYNTELRLDFWKNKQASGMSKEIENHWRMLDRKSYADKQLFAMQGEIVTWLQRRYKHLYADTLAVAKAEDKGNIPARSRESIFAEHVELWKLRAQIPDRVDRNRMEKDLPKEALTDANFMLRTAESHPVVHAQLLLQQQTLLQQNALAAASAAQTPGTPEAPAPKDAAQTAAAQARWQADKDQRRQAWGAASALAAGAASQAGTQPGLPPP
jgi:hypothetical protein